MILAQNGLSKYKVIIPAEASPAVKFAAEEFVGFFRRSCGRSRFCFFVGILI